MESSHLLHNLVIFGTGYVGLVTGACFADMGLNVICIDNNVEKIKALKNGVLPIYEPQLPELVGNNVQAGRLQFSHEPQNAVGKADFIVIAVGTPGTVDGAADTTSIFNVAKQIGEVITTNKTVIIKSTVPVGTCEKVKSFIEGELIKRNLGHVSIFVVSNPEFLKEGSAVEDCLKPERIIIGTDSQEALLKMEALYRPFSRLGYKIVHMSLRSAELSKYVANAMLSLRISFMNEVSQLCEKVGGDIEDIRKAIGSDSRIGKQFLYAGLGYGGSCFPKDNTALEYLGLQNDLELPIISAVIKTNNSQKIKFLNKIMRAFLGNVENKIISILGVAFKPNTNDIRHSPGLFLANELFKSGAKIHLYDPIVTTDKKNVEMLLTETNNQFQISKNLLECVKNSSAIVLCTEWHEFRMMDFEMLSDNMREKFFFDGRNQYQKTEIEKFGFHYFSIGRRS